MFKNVILILITLIIFNLSLKEYLGNTVDNTGGHVGSCSRRFDCRENCSNKYKSNKDIRNCKKSCDNKYQCR